jgi:uncharacterized protein (TIGR02646 family)
MRAITKGPEPPSLTAHRLTPHSDYENYARKDDLRDSLTTEQRALCCYCMGRIRSGPTAMKIEHWQSQTHYPAEQLSYPNLIGACLGGEGQPWHLQHCDTRKGDRDLRWNPANPSHHIERHLRYELDGSITSDDPQFDDQLNQVLNLNLPVLKNNRKGVLTAILDWWKREKARIHGPVTRMQFERERERYTTGGGQLTPYSQAVVWWLDQRLFRIG